MWKKIFMLVKRHYIISTIIGIITAIFILDDHLAAVYEAPYHVGEAFSWGFMTKNPKLMKEWSDKSIYKRIELLEYADPFRGTSHPISGFDLLDDFKLASLSRIGDTIVASYAYDSLVYSVVLSPLGRKTIWETIKSFIFEKVPLGDKFISMPNMEKRWLVTNFFGNDDLEKLIEAENQKIERLIFEEIDDASIDRYLRKVEKKVEAQIQFQKIWGDAEMIAQNARLKKWLYVYNQTGF